MLRTALHDIAPLLAGADADINTKGVIDFFLTKIAPILFAILGLIFIGRANKGEISKVMTSSVIAIIGLVFIAGAVVLVLLGGTLADIFFTN